MTWEIFTNWASHPFSTDMDWKHWGLFVGLMLIFMLAWRMVLSHLEI
jgi:hypothetical protein